jgi:hypothetical protein
MEEGGKMGFLDKMKGAVNAMTGGGADVSIEYPMQAFKIGDTLHVKVTVMSTGGEIKSNGVYVDVRAREHGTVSARSTCRNCHQSSSSSVNISNTTVEQQIPIAPAFVLGANERKEYEADIQLPNGQPTYRGSIDHDWQLRGRLDAFGNDPDSGFKNIDVH